MPTAAGQGHFSLLGGVLHSVEEKSLQSLPMPFLNGSVLEHLQGMLQTWRLKPDTLSPPQPAEQSPALRTESRHSFMLMAPGLHVCPDTLPAERSAALCEPPAKTCISSSRHRFIFSSHKDPHLSFIGLQDIVLHFVEELQRRLRSEVEEAPPPAPRQHPLEASGRAPSAAALVASKVAAAAAQVRTGRLLQRCTGMLMP